MYDTTIDAPLQTNQEAQEDPDAALYGLSLTQGQKAALESLQNFLIDGSSQVFVLGGYSGCGKSTLVQVFMKMLPAYVQAMRLVDPDFTEFDIRLTATTNKAAENLALITGREVTTIHSALGLKVVSDFKTGKTSLEITKKSEYLENCVVFIDEASFVDSPLLGYVFSRTRNCKIVFIGDPAQLAPVGYTEAPVFKAKFPGYELTEVVRQAEGNPIIELSTKFREYVRTGVPFQFTPDGVAVQRVSREDFNTLIEQEFVRPDWKYHDSKILFWTNKSAIAYNNMVRGMVKGDPEFHAGDYAICNSFVTGRGSSIKTDSTVYISEIEPESTHLGCKGNWVTLDGRARWFHPRSLKERAAALREAKEDNHYNAIQEIENSWVDLRGAYASTINKAQGSTYGKVFIDLNDIKGCRSEDARARMLYVAVSRAKHTVYLTGDLA